MQSLPAIRWVFLVMKHAAPALTCIDSPCIYDLKKNKPGVKTGVIEGLSRRVGTYVKLDCYRHFFNKGRGS